MKKLFIPTALAVMFLLTSGGWSQEAPKVEEEKAAVAAAPAAAVEKSAAVQPPAVDKTNDKAKAEKAVAAPVKAHVDTKKGEHHHAASHHSKVNRKLANELTDKLNAMTCPFAVATASAPAPAAA